MPRYSQIELRRNRENRTELKLIDLQNDITNKNKFFTTKTDPKTIVIVKYLGEEKFKYYPHLTVDPTADINGYEIKASQIKMNTEKIRFILFETIPTSGTAIGDPIESLLTRSGGKTRKNLKRKKSKKSKKKN